MGKILYHVQDNWAGGVNTAAQPDQVGPITSPRALNTALAFTSVGTAAIGKRRGMSVMNTTPTTGEEAIQGQYEFRLLSGGAFTKYHILIDSTGALYTMDTDGVVTTVDASALGPIGYFPSFATMNNLCFMAIGSAQKKFNGTSVQAFGIVEPSTAPTLAVGAAGTPNGTYESRVTFYNSATGHESSAGPTSGTVTVVSQRITFSSIPVSADTQVTSRKVYLRNTATMANFYLATTISDNVTTTYSHNAADSTLITLGPDTAENDPPPATVKFLAVHRSRMFAADDTALYYSKVSFPESFDPDFTEPVNPNDGQAITGIHAAHDVLIIFKSSSMYALVGDGPDDWAIRLVDPDIGTTSHRSVVTVEGRTYFWSEQGPMVWDGEGRPTPIGRPLIEATIAPAELNGELLIHVAAAADLAYQRVMFAVPSVGQTKLDLILPYNYRLGVWESEQWDPVNVGSFGVADDDVGRPWVFIGSNAGQVFKWWNADVDGVADGTTTTGTFVATDVTMTSITDTAASFDITGGGLVERKVTFLDPDGRAIGGMRRYVTANTATVLSLSSAINDLVTGYTYTYIIGGPAFELDNAWGYFDLPFHKKRYEFLFVEAITSSDSVVIICDIAFNYDQNPGQSHDLEFVVTSTSSVWDSAIWDSSIFADVQNIGVRKRVGKTGKSYRVRLRNYYPNQPMLVTKVGMQAALMTTKS